MEPWFEYVNVSYDLITDAQHSTATHLPHELEAYAVHLMARNFTRTTIGQEPVGIRLLQAMNARVPEIEYMSVADECLLINSWPLRTHRWPSPDYYQTIGTTAYGLANHEMQYYFAAATTILHRVFAHQTDQLNQLTIIKPN